MVFLNHSIFQKSDVLFPENAVLLHNHLVENGWKKNKQTEKSRNNITKSFYNIQKSPPFFFLTETFDAVNAAGKSPLEFTWLTVTQWVIVKGGGEVGSKWKWNVTESTGVSHCYLWISSSFNTKGNEKHTHTHSHSHSQLTPVSWKRLVDLLILLVQLCPC